MDDPSLLLVPDALLPMDPAQPQVLTHAGLVLAGDRIAALGPLSTLREQFPGIPEQRVPGTLLPGFVNAHTHLELSYQSAATLKPESFPQWVSQLIAAYPPPEQVEPTVRAAIRQGLAESLAAGVTTLGDISRHVSITRDEIAVLARNAPTPRVVSFGEVVGLGKMRLRAAELIDTASTLPPSLAGLESQLFAGISPHAPYTVEGPVLRACVRRAIIKRLPLAMHLAELPDEAAFLRDLSGPLGRDWDLMQKMDILDEHISLMKGGPVRWAQLWGLLLADARERPRSFPVLLAHVNYCDRAELAQLAASRASIAYCPRTHAYFGHPPHPFADMLASGLNVCLATDSRASNPDLSLLREAQFVRRQHGTDPFTLLEMITHRAAAALGLEAHVGSLSVGKFADLVLLPLADQDRLLERIVEDAPAPAAVWIGGRRV